VFDEAEIDSFTFTRSKSSPSHYIDKDIYFNGLDIASVDIEKLKGISFLLMTVKALKLNLSLYINV
jgi:hypothetical protein